MSKPSICELIDDSRNGPADGNVLLLLPKDREAFDVLMARAHAGFLLAGRVEKVLALHSEVEPHMHERASAHCDECLSPWPCATVRLLNGEDK
jgi:hypothetical protein